MLYNFVPADVYGQIASRSDASVLIMSGRTPESYGFFSENPETVYAWMVKRPSSLQIFHDPNRVLEAMGALAMESKMAAL
jgi:predicted secreted protein